MTASTSAGWTNKLSLGILWFVFIACIYANGMSRHRGLAALAVFSAFALLAGFGKLFGEGLADAPVSWLRDGSHTRAVAAIAWVVSASWLIQLIDLPASSNGTASFGDVPFALVTSGLSTWLVCLLLWGSRTFDWPATKKRLYAILGIVWTAFSAVQLAGILLTRVRR